MDNSSYYLRKSTKKNTYEVVNVATEEVVVISKSPRQYVAMMIGRDIKGKWYVWARFGRVGLIGQNDSKYHVDRPGVYVAMLRT